MTQPTISIFVKVGVPGTLNPSLYPFILLLRVFILYCTIKDSVFIVTLRLSCLFLPITRAFYNFFRIVFPTVNSSSKFKHHDRPHIESMMSRGAPQTLYTRQISTVLLTPLTMYVNFLFPLPMFRMTVLSFKKVLLLYRTLSVPKNYRPLRMSIFELHINRL